MSQSNPTRRTDYAASGVAVNALHLLRVRYVYEQSLPGVIVNLLLSATLTVLLWDIVETRLLAGWFVTLTGVGLVRLKQRVRVLTSLSAESMPCAESRFRVLLLCSALLWSVGAVMMVRDAPIEYQFLIVLVLAGLCAGGIVNLSPIQSYYRLYVPTMLLPISLWCAAQDSAVYRSLALMSLVFGVALLSAGRNYSKHFNRSAELAAALHASESRLSQIMDLVPVQIFARDADGRFLIANEATARFFGRRVPEIIESRLPTLIGNAAWADVHRAADARIISGTDAEVVTEEELLDSAAQVRVLRITRVGFDDPISGQRGVLGIAMDVTAESTALQALRQSEARFSSAFRNAPIGMLLIAGDGTVINSNPVGEAIFGAAPEYWRGRSFWALAADADAARMTERCAALLSGEIVDFVLETYQTTCAGTPIWVMISASSVPSSANGIVRAIVQIQDVTANHIMADRLCYQATHDDLTDLINRREFEVRLQRALDSIPIDRTQHALLYVDLDNFKLINDSCGHVAGDALLQQIGGLLRNQVRKHDSVARIGGDEFAVLLEYCPLGASGAIADNICKAVAALRFTWDSKVFIVGASIGLVWMTSPDAAVASLFRAADAACYAAKEAGRGRVYQFDPADAELTRHRQQIDSVAFINRALECDLFEIHAQPIQATRRHGDGASSHIEILLRLRDNHGATIAPGLFLPAAERFGLVSKIDRWVIRNTCAAFGRQRGWLDMLELCSINISGQSLSDPNLQQFIEAQFAHHALPPNRFCFEITETAAIARIDLAQQFVVGLQRCGFRFALDDFGSGLSSFGYLKTLPFDMIKIDGIFIRNIVNDQVDEAMVRSIIEVARIMDKVTVAEFVETAAQAAMLTRLGIDFMQGYLIGRPLPIGELFDKFARTRYGEVCMAV